MITNDGATILKEMNVVHPAAKMVNSTLIFHDKQMLIRFYFHHQLVELSKAQDSEAGDGTTSVVVLCGSLLEVAERLLAKGIHPTSISDAFQKAAIKSVEILISISNPVSLDDRESLIKAAATSLNSKVRCTQSSKLVMKMGKVI